MIQTKHIHQKGPSCTEAVQAKFWNPDTHNFDYGLAYHGDIISGSTGKIFESHDIRTAAPDNLEPLLKYPDWTDFSAAMADTAFDASVTDTYSDKPVPVRFWNYSSGAYDMGIFYEDTLITAANGTILEASDICRYAPLSVTAMLAANSWPDMTADICREHDMKLLDSTYPKSYFRADFSITRPYGICVHGPAVSPETALEIIRQTDWIFGGAYDKDPLVQKALTQLGIRGDTYYSQFDAYSLSRQCFDYSKFEALWKYSPSTYLFCNWFASSDHDSLPIHGFCHPDGTIYDCMIQGGSKYYRKFDVNEFDDSRFYREIRNLMFRFPMLNLYFDLYNIDSFDDEQNLLPDAVPVVQFHAYDNQIVVDRFDPAPWQSPLQNNYKPLTAAQIDDLKIDLSGIYEDWAPVNAPERTDTDASHASA